MSTTIHLRASSRSRRRLAMPILIPIVIALAACGDPSASDDAAASDAPAAAEGAALRHDRLNGHTARPSLVSAAMLANAGYQDVDVAEAAGYASSIDTLGCFQNPEQGGMGVHYIDGGALDAVVDVRHPEALVYELDANGRVAGLVAHEYIVPIDAWTSTKPPTLFGMDFHRHATLPLWVLHTWLWKANPSGVFADWNPAVRQCPPGVPVFGQDLPAA